VSMAAVNRADGVHSVCTTCGTDNGTQDREVCAKCHTSRYDYTRAAGIHPTARDYDAQTGRPAHWLKD
jgi:hypothetical protein